MVDSTLHAEEQEMLFAAVERKLYEMYVNMSRIKYEDGALMHPLPTPKRFPSPSNMKKEIVEHVMGWCAWPVPDLDAPELKKVIKQNVLEQPYAASVGESMASVSAHEAATKVVSNTRVLQFIATDVMDMLLKEAVNEVDHADTKMLEKQKAAEVALDAPSPEQSVPENNDATLVDAGTINAMVRASRCQQPAVISVCDQEHASCSKANCSTSVRIKPALQMSPSELPNAHAHSVVPGQPVMPVHPTMPVQPMMPPQPVYYIVPSGPQVCASFWQF
jgi:hypothetical protein